MRTTPAYALSVSDALDYDRLQERIEVLSILSQMMPHMDAVCVRDDAMDAEALCETARAASTLGLRVIVDSILPSALIQAAVCLEDGSPILMSPEGDQNALIGVASMSGCPIILSSSDPETLERLIDSAKEGGIEDIMINPPSTSMKGCLESNVRIRRLMESGDLPELPMVSRSWSGEYALAVSTVSLSAGGSLTILDDLDMECCAVLEMIVGNLPDGPVVR